MASPALDDDTGDKPLDPAVERVRAKLIRFMAVNLALLLVALMAVLGAIVYKTAAPDGEATADAAAPPTRAGQVRAEIPLPAGAEILSQSLSGSTLSLHARLAGGSTAIFVYDLEARRLVGRHDIVAED